MPRRWLGIDFSGNYRMWKATKTNSNVWIADIHEDDGELRLTDLKRVQQLAGSTHPFDRLVTFLKNESFDAAGIDAPFSVPKQFVPMGGHVSLLALVDGLDRGGRPFPTGRSFVKAVSGVDPPLSPAKPLRSTEQGWGCNARSTVWAGRGRPGAPFTAACLTLLAEVDGVVWPWASGARLLVEAFPLAQLRAWKIECAGYDKTENVRAKIVETLSERLSFGSHESAAKGSADAIDAVISAFAGRAATTGMLKRAPHADSLLEGWIAVHR